MASKSGVCNSSSRNNNMNKGGEKKLDFWRDYFRKANSDIFDIIEHAIMVAASDCPKEFRIRKARIAELLFSCRLTRCLGCDRVELAVSQVEQHHHDDHGINDHDVDDVLRKNCFDDHGGGGSKGSNKVVYSATRDDVVNGGSNDDELDDDELDVDIDIEGDVNGATEMVNNTVDIGSNLSFGDAEALTDEIEEERELINEVLRIKDVLHNSQDESESELYASLRRLELMNLTVNILKETEIGKAVNSIRRHSSKDIRHLSRALIDGWKIIVDEWVKSTQELAEGGTPDSVNPSTVDEEEGLPSPPMDEGLFFSTQAMDFTQFFDGMDDDGNPRNSGELNKHRGPGRKPSTVKQDAPKPREEHPKEATPISKDNRTHQMRRQQPLPKPSRPSNTQSGPGRPSKSNADPKVSRDTLVLRKPERPEIQRRPAPQPEKLRSPNDDLVQEKLEATKRKLQERYQQAENAKRQRTIQVMEIQDLPKQGMVNKNPHGKFGNRNWANGRR